MRIPHIHAPDALESPLAMLTDFLESRVAEGVGFEPGQTIRIGWMWFKVGADSEGQPVILAPKGGTLPMEFRSDCSQALNLILTQRYVCDSFGVDLSDCTARHSAIVVKDIARCRKVFMNRTDPEN